jgi:TM2 domain-containing membrane protein YozV
VPSNVVRGSAQQVVIVKAGKSAGLAAVLSFFWCGLGQVYNGQIGKGVVLILAYIVSLLLIFLLIGLITTPILWIWGMVDAYRTAEKLNEEVGLA